VLFALTVYVYPGAAGTVIVTLLVVVVAPVYFGMLPAVPFGPPVMLMLALVATVTLRFFVCVNATVAVTVAPEAGAATEPFEPEPVFFATATVYDLIDYLTSNMLLPMGGLSIALFVGWATSGLLLREELQLQPLGSRALRFLLRYVAPVAIVLATLVPLLG